MRTRSRRGKKETWRTNWGVALFGAIAGFAIVAVLGGCASVAKTAVPKPLPVEAPKGVPVFVVDGNPVQQKIIHIVLDGVPVMDIGWRYTGSKASNPAFLFPFDVNMSGRKTMFYEVVSTNLTGHPIRYIEGRSTDESSLLGPSDGNQKRIKPKIVRRADIGENIAVYDVVSPEGQTRSDFYVYGPRDGSRPYSENTYTYYIEGLEKWFAVKYVRGGPDVP